MGQTGATRIWTELSELLRAMRVAAGTSLRQVEARSGIGRGTLSSIENAKAKPSRSIVEWYDREFGGDGLPLTMYAEARNAHGTPPRTTARPQRCAHPCGDVIRVEENDPPQGEIVAPDAPLKVRWRLRNEGSEAWTGRVLRRVGIPSAPGLIGSDATAPVPDAAPGQAVDVEFVVSVPADERSYVAYWDLVHEDGELCAARNAQVRLAVIVRA